MGAWNLPKVRNYSHHVRRNLLDVNTYRRLKKCSWTVARQLRLLGGDMQLQALEVRSSVSEELIALPRRSVTCGS